MVCAQTCVGSRKPAAHSVKRMQYQPRSPKQPWGSRTLSVRMLEV